MKIFSKSLTLSLVCILFSLIMIPSMSVAGEAFDANRDVSLTIEYEYEDVKLSNMIFNIYKVGDIDENAKITLLSEFSEYPVDFTELDQNGWNEYALTLKGYVLKDNVAPILSKATDENGILKAQLKPGLYLVIGEKKAMNGYYYESSPYLIILPGYEKETGKWNYDVSSKPKAKAEKIVENKINKKVIKVWRDNNYKSERPEKVVIELLANGKVYSSAELNKENNWQHTWSQLDPKVNWTVVEKDVDSGKYTVAIKEEGHTFTVVNTRKSDGTGHVPGDDEKPSKPTDDQKPSKPTDDQKPSKPTDGKKPSQPSQTTKKPSGRLPQTGQLWWPVYVLIGAGILFVLIGFVKNKMAKKEQKH